MKSIILLLLFLVSADTTIVDTDMLKVVKFGNLSKDNTVQIIQPIYQSIAILSNCQITWKSGDYFYMVSISPNESYAIKKSTYDNLKKQYQNDETISQILADNGQICEIELLESY